MDKVEFHDLKEVGGIELEGREFLAARYNDGWVLFEPTSAKHPYTVLRNGRVSSGYVELLYGDLTPHSNLEIIFRQEFPTDEWNLVHAYEAQSRTKPLSVSV